MIDIDHSQGLSYSNARWILEEIRRGLCVQSSQGGGLISARTGREPATLCSFVLCFYTGSLCIWFSTIFRILLHSLKIRRCLVRL